MWHKSEFVALQKLFDSKFDSKLEDVLYDDEIDAIKRNGKIAWDNIKNRVIIPPHNQKVCPDNQHYLMIDLDQNHHYTTACF